MTASTHPQPAALTPQREQEIRARLDAEDRDAIELTDMVDELLTILASATPNLLDQETKRLALETRVTELTAERDATFAAAADVVTRFCPIHGWHGPAFERCCCEAADRLKHEGGEGRG